jgi:phosphate transport system protein
MKYPEHTSTQYDVELKTVCASVLRMGEAVESQLRDALEALATGDLITIDRVIKDGIVVNAMEIEIDESCTNILVRRQPTANDLRLVKTIIKTINDLERIGDEAESIALMAKLMIRKNSSLLPRYRQIIYTADIALEMLGAALDAFENLDTDAARKVGRKDDLIDEEFRSILRHLAAYMMEDTGELTMALNAALVARSIERIGDHAKSISGYVIYVMEGREGRNV